MADNPTFVELEVKAAIEKDIRLKENRKKVVRQEPINLQTTVNKSFKTPNIKTDG